MAAHSCMKGTGIARALILYFTKFLCLIKYLCDFLGHHDLLSYIAIAENESKARVRFNLLDKMFQPCGPPPDRPNLD